MDGLPSLLELCVQHVAQGLIKYGRKRALLSRISELPEHAFQRLLETLVAKNALNERLDSLLLQQFTHKTHRLGLEGACQLRRSVLMTIGRSCPNLRALDVRRCQQVGNRIVRATLQYCEHLESLLLDGCVRISDNAFAPTDTACRTPLPGLRGMRELSVGECSQITSGGLMDHVMSGAQHLRALGLAFCRLAVTDEVASRLLCDFELEAVDLSFCSQVTDSSLTGGHLSSSLRELRLTDAPVTDGAVEQLAQRAPQLEVFDAGWVLQLTDSGVCGLLAVCDRLRRLCVRSTQITDRSFHVIARCRSLEHLDASWCLRATSQALTILANPAEAARPCELPPIRAFVLDHLGAVLPSLVLPTIEEVALPPSLTPLVSTYASSIEQLSLDGLSEVVSADALQAIADRCRGLQQLALAIPPGCDNDDSLKSALKAIGSQCCRLWFLKLDVSARPHHAVVECLSFPSFWGLRSLFLSCAGSTGGLLDDELELILGGRTRLETLNLRNCEGLSQGLFPRWCHRRDVEGGGEVAKAAEAAEAAAAAALADRDPGVPGRPYDAHSIGSMSTEAPESIVGGGSPPPECRQCSAALALQSVTTLSLAGVIQLSDLSADALAEMLHGVQTVELHGCPQLTVPSSAVQPAGSHSCPALHSFTSKDRCRFIRSVSIIAAGDRSVSWTAATSTTGGSSTGGSRRHRKRSGVRASRLATIAEQRGQECSSGTEMSS